MPESRLAIVLLVLVAVGIGGPAPGARRTCCGRVAPRSAVDIDALRVRDDAVRARRAPSLLDPLLPRGDAVHPVRHRGGVPLSRGP